jgi:carbonic anhydrase
VPEVAELVFVRRSRAKLLLRTCSQNTNHIKMNKTSKLALIAFVSLTSAGVSAVAAEPSAASVGADTALTRLKEGNARFSSNKVSDGKPNAAKREETAKAQHPYAIIVACADSRTAPELVFDSNIGDLFVVRTAGNLVDDHALGSIEYAVEHLGARLIVVLGHQRCGAVMAALASDTAPGHVASLVRDIQPAVNAAKGKPGDATDNTIAENARLVATEIGQDASLGEVAKQIRIVSAVYSLDNGKVKWATE